MVQWFYRKLLNLYPQAFRECLGESMQQTFDDLYNQRRRQPEQGMFGFVLWMFLETGVGIFREHLLLIPKGDMMQTVLRPLGSSVLISSLLILPLAIMEVVNRRHFNEEFPTILFFMMWLNVFALGLIVLPIVQSKWTANQDAASSMPTQGNTLFANPWWAAVIGLILYLFPLILFWVDSLIGTPIQYLLNGPDPEQPYPLGQFVGIAIFLVPVAAGIIAGRPIVTTLRAGGSLFAHPINLIVIVVIVSSIAIGLTSLVIDQWPCFMGVPNCD